MRRKKSNQPEVRGTVKAELTLKTGLPVYAVFWMDATKRDDHEEKDPLTPLLACTVGYVISMTEEHITIVQELFTDGHARNENSIPMGMVKAMNRVGRIRVPAKVKKWFVP